MRKLVLPPSQPGYGVGLGTDTLTAALSAGPSRTRRDFIGAVAEASVSWALDDAQYDYMMSFYRVVGCAEPWLLDMILDTYALAEYEVKFVAGSFRLSDTRGLRQIVEARLEVKPLVSDPEFDEAVLDIYELYGDDASAVFDELEKLVNESLAA